MQKIRINGARAHNLKNISVDIPRQKLVVVTGVSGSGKSSLAFDTVFAEGQRRYVESLSAYARQFLHVMEKPDVDSIDGLSPTISIDQKSASHNPRSTVGTVTEINDYMRLLFARIGQPYCPRHGIRLESQSTARVVDSLLANLPGKKTALLAPVVIDRRGEYLELFREMAGRGFSRVRVDGKFYAIEDAPSLAKTVKHTIEIVVDRLRIDAANRQRLTESIETATSLADGRLHVLELEKAENPDAESATEESTTMAEESSTATKESAAMAKKSSTATETMHTFSTRHSCPKCGHAPPELEPKLFSFNNPKSACKTCEGLGMECRFDAALIVEHPSLSLSGGAIRGWDKRNPYLFAMLQAVATHYDFSLDTPFEKYGKKTRHLILFGSGRELLTFKYKMNDGREHRKEAVFEGILHNIKRRWRETDSPHVRDELARYMATRVCSECNGARLSPDALAVRINEQNIHALSALSLNDLALFFEQLKLNDTQAAIAARVTREIRERVRFLINVGLDYLSLQRAANTLSGGESQRIRLASQIGSGLTGVTYVLDEPSIGLHQHDNARLLDTLTQLRDLDNTVIVVEHDEEAIRRADYVIDMGIGAGVHGGRMVVCGTPDKIARHKKSLTGQYLRGDKFIAVPKKRRQSKAKITISQARGNNLQGGDFSFPLGLFTCVTGVSGSGKSTLVRDILVRATRRHLYGGGEEPLPHKSIVGLDEVQKIVVVDQSPIGRTPRSNPATYTGMFTPLRELFAGLPMSRERGYLAGRFSFNVSGGRCENCEGDGVMRIEMHFLPDVFVTCETCKGKRYNRETLEVRYRDKNIHQVLAMTVDDALLFFANIPAVARKLKTLQDVGLGYITLGQSATTLSGGEAQRIKLSLELSKQSGGKNLYVLDEPTTGLHFHDVKMLLAVLQRLTDEGNTVITIEHNLDVIKTADWILDLGPKGGAAGGKLIAEGPPEQIAANKNSLTGLHLRKMLEKNAVLKAA